MLRHVVRVPSSSVCAASERCPLLARDTSRAPRSSIATACSLLQVMGVAPCGATVPSASEVTKERAVRVVRTYIRVAHTYVCIREARLLRASPRHAALHSHPCRCVRLTEVAPYGATRLRNDACVVLGHAVDRAWQEA